MAARDKIRAGRQQEREARERHMRIEQELRARRQREHEARDAIEDVIEIGVIYFIEMGDDARNLCGEVLAAILPAVQQEIASRCGFPTWQEGPHPQDPSTLPPSRYWAHYYESHGHPLPPKPPRRRTS
jgi:hypothetical protein